MMCVLQVHAAHPLGQMICLVVLPHVLQHLVDCIGVGSLPVEVQAHQAGHSSQQAGDLFQLLPGTLHSIGPRMVHQENTKGRMPNTRVVLTLSLSNSCLDVRLMQVWLQLGNIISRLRYYCKIDLKDIGWPSYYS